MSKINKNSIKTKCTDIISKPSFISNTARLFTNIVGVFIGKNNSKPKSKSQWELNKERSEKKLEEYHNERSIANEKYLKMHKLVLDVIRQKIKNNEYTKNKITDRLDIDVVAEAKSVLPPKDHDLYIKEYIRNHKNVYTLEECLRP
jgi:hypothetical protein